MKVSYRDFLVTEGFTNRELRQHLHMDGDVPTDKDYRDAEDLLIHAVLCLSDSSLKGDDEDWSDRTQLEKLSGIIVREREEDFPLPVSRSTAEKAREGVSSFRGRIFSSPEAAWKTLEAAGRRRGMYGLHLSEGTVFSSETYSMIKNEDLRKSLLSFALSLRGLGGEVC